MDTLEELVKSYIEFQKETFDCTNISDKDMFKYVIENIKSIVESYTYSDYVKDKEDNSDGK